MSDESLKFLYIPKREIYKLLRTKISVSFIKYLMHNIYKKLIYFFINHSINE